MPGAVLIDDKLDSLRGHQPSPPSPLDQRPCAAAPLRHYIPVLTRSVAPACNEADLLSPLRRCRRPASVGLNINALPDTYAEDGSLLVEVEPIAQWSPLSAAQFANNGVSPKSLSALSALRRFLPSNLDREGADSVQYDMYSGDQFRMYEFKVRKCMKGRSHDWTECPFAHPGEKARRRDPRMFNYVGVLCADYKKGNCKKGDACDLAHGVFECWLHPTRYRTQPCKDGRGCRRRICFFAHTPDQLRDGSPASSSPSSPLTTFLCPTSGELSSDLLDSSCSFTNASRHFVNNCFPDPLLAPLSFAGTDAFIGSNLSPRSIPFELSPSVSTLQTSHERHVDISSGSSPSNFRLPVSMLGEMGQSLQFNPGDITKASNNHAPLDVQNSSAPPSRGLPLMTPSPLALSGSVQASQKMEELVRLMRLVDLAQDQEPGWKEKLPSTGAQEEFPVQPQSIQNMSHAPTEKCRGNEDFIFGRSFFDEEDEPRLERVESGKGLRSQIFESLISSAGLSSM